MWKNACTVRIEIENSLNAHKNQKFKIDEKIDLMINYLVPNHRKLFDIIYSILMSPPWEQRWGRFWGWGGTKSLVPARAAKNYDNLFFFFDPLTRWSEVPVVALSFGQRENNCFPPPKDVHSFRNKTDGRSRLDFKIIQIPMPSWIPPCHPTLDRPLLIPYYHENRPRPKDDRFPRWGSKRSVGEDFRRSYYIPWSIEYALLFFSQQGDDLHPCKWP